MNFIHKIEKQIDFLSPILLVGLQQFSDNGIEPKLDRAIFLSIINGSIRKYLLRVNIHDKAEDRHLRIKYIKKSIASVLLALDEVVSDEGVAFGKEVGISSYHRIELEGILGC